MFVLECVCVWFKYSHPGGCDAVMSPCGFDLFCSVTARSLLRCFSLHAASLPVSSPATVRHPHAHHQQRVFPLGTSMQLPLHFTLFSPPFTRADETSASLSILMTFKHLKGILTLQTQPSQRRHHHRLLWISCLFLSVESLSLSHFCGFCPLYRLTGLLLPPCPAGATRPQPRDAPSRPELPRLLLLGYVLVVPCFPSLLACRKENFLQFS